MLRNSAGSVTWLKAPLGLTWNYYFVVRWGEFQSYFVHSNVGMSFCLYLFIWGSSLNHLRVNYLFCE